MRAAMRHRRAASCSTAAVLTLASSWLGCSGPPNAGRMLGNDLGTFTVAATRAENDCDEGALGSPREFAFDVELARADTELFWDGRVGGRLGAALEFEFAASVKVEPRQARGANAGCTILRDDVITGRLATGDAGEVTSFSGKMSYAFAEVPESTCTLEERQAAGVPRLPCRSSYTLAGRRTRAPSP